MLRRAFQFDHDDIHSGVAGVLGQVGDRSFILRLPGLDCEVYLFTVRKGKRPLGVSEEHRNRSGMAMHDRLLVWPVVHLQNSYLIVLSHYGVMLGISLDRILGRDESGKTKAHRYAIQR